MKQQTKPMINFRKATEKDLPAIVALLADDDLGKAREILSNPLSKTYLDAFKIIDLDPNQELMVLENEN